VSATVPESVVPPDPKPRWRVGVRAQLILLLLGCFTAVFGVVFSWIYGFATERTATLLRIDLDHTLAGAAAGIDGDELVGLYREGQPSPDGFSADPRYVREVDDFERVRAIDPRAWPYTFVRGDRPDTRRIGPKAASPEFVYVADANSRHERKKAAPFLASDTGSAVAVQAWESNRLVERPDIYTDRFGSWMTSYAPIHDSAGNVVAILGIDYSAEYVGAVQQSIRRQLLMFFAGAYVVLLLLAWLASGVITRPLLALKAATDDLRAGQLGSSVEIGRRGDEVGALARAFNAMSRRLAGAFRDLANANEVLEERVVERTSELAAERDKSERLLRNVLPAEIAERLKRDPSAIADGYEAVTVLFADIVGFTEMSARVKPIELVALLNEVFSGFDALAAEHGLEKIKTIGDAYMVVGGLPTPRPDHVEAVARMALAMQALMRALAEKHPGLAVRVGIHTGPVVAGVLGTQKFSYDLWGDTVNIASRLESHGERGRIHVSAAVAEVLRGAFDVQERGQVTLKGRGAMMTYWILGARVDAPAPSR
jgi:class 3 adenylate cyclase